MNNFRQRLLQLACLVGAVAVTGCGGGGTSTPTESPLAGKAELPPFNFEIKTLSNRADLISDGNALVEVLVPKTVPMKKVTLLLNGTDVTSSFVADANASTLRGVVSGMAVGAREARR